MNEIRLEKQSWLFDESDPIGPEGGFGAVFSGLSPDGQKVVVKLIAGRTLPSHRAKSAIALLLKSLDHCLLPASQTQAEHSFPGSAGSFQ